MRTDNVTIRNRALLALFAVASLLLATASPAFAAKTITGAGAGVGTEDGGEVNDICPPLPDFPPGEGLMGTLSEDRFALGHFGNWTATDTSGTTTAVYLGPSTTIIKIGPHVISPEGTYTECYVPLPIPVQSWHVISPGHPQTGVFNTGTGGVSCTGQGGEYQRRAANTVQFVLRNGSCSVKGDQLFLTGQAQNVTTFMAIEGEMHPCLDNPLTEENEAAIVCPVDPNAGSNLETTYQAGGADPGPIP